MKPASRCRVKKHRRNRKIPARNRIMPRNCVTEVGAGRDEYVPGSHAATGETGSFTARKELAAHVRDSSLGLRESVAEENAAQARLLSVTTMQRAFVPAIQYVVQESVKSGLERAPSFCRPQVRGFKAHRIFALPLPMVGTHLGKVALCGPAELDFGC